MKRALLFSSALSLVVGCSSFSGSDTNPGGGGDDGGSADGSVSALDAGGVMGGGHEGGVDGGSGGADGGDVPVDGGVDPMACNVGSSVLCQDFRTASSVTDGYVNGTRMASGFKTYTYNGGTVAPSGMTMQARVYGGSSQIAFIESPTGLGVSSFALTLWFSMNITDPSSAEILVLSLGNGSVTFKATATTINVTSSLVGSAMLTTTTTADTVLSVIYANNTFTISANDKAMTTMPYNNGVLDSVNLGAHSSDGVQTYVKGYRVNKL